MSADKLLAWYTVNITKYNSYSMILSNNGIRSAFDRGDVEMQPMLDERDLREVGIRVHLGAELLIPVSRQLVDVEKQSGAEYQSESLALDSYTLPPGGFVLAPLRERLKMNGAIVPILDGRSTLARLGLTIHNTATLLDGCFGTWITPILEMHNNGKFDIVLRSGIPIAMVYFALLDSPVVPVLAKSVYADANSIGPRF